MGALTLMDTGVLLTIFSFVPSAPLVCRASSLFVTSLFCAACGAMYYRQLLRYLVLSFDFIFFSSQFTAIHLCLCDLLKRDARAIPVVSSWLWIHWVLTFDCMPPATKAKWGFRYRFAVWIAVLFVLAHVTVSCQVVFGRQDTLRDRALVSIHAFHLHMEVRVLPTMLSRMLVTFGRSCRIVCRLWHRKEDELLIIQGTVTYVNNRKKLKRDEKELERLQSKERRTSLLINVARSSRTHQDFKIGATNERISRLTSSGIATSNCRDETAARAQSLVNNMRLDGTRDLDVEPMGCVEL